MRVLLVEDDDTIADPLIEGLGRYGFAVTRVVTGAAALEARCGDLVLLDLGLPDMDGIDVCRELRRTSQVPIIMLTARGSETDRVVGLEMGADDYLAKPFSVRELVARMRAVARRTCQHGPAGDGTPPAMSAGHPAPASEPVGLLVDGKARQVWLYGRAVVLSPKEFDVVALLDRERGTVVSRQRLIDEVWGPRFFSAGKTLDFHVASVRRKLGDPRWVETRRGVGFRLAVPGPPSPPQR